MTTALQPIAPDLWAAEHDLYVNGLMHFRGRMTVVRLADGALLLHSVVPIDDAIAAALAELGPVRHLVAPSCLHHVHLAAAVQRFPDAQVWGPPGLARKQPGVPLSGTLPGDAPPWAPELAPLPIAGAPWTEEIVFLHRESRTLLVTDLVFNIHEVHGWFTPLVLRMVGVWRRLAQSRLMRLATRDREAARASIEAMLAWDFDRVVMAHGRIVERDGKAAMQQALWWMRGVPALRPSVG